jgi:hypothetical protein
VLKPIRQDSKGQRLHMGDRVVSALPIRLNSWELRNLSDPPTVVLAFDLNLVIHARNSPLRYLPSM